MLAVLIEVDQRKQAHRRLWFFLSPRYFTLWRAVSGALGMGSGLANRIIFSLMACIAQPFSSSPYTRSATIASEPSLCSFHPASPPNMRVRQPAIGPAAWWLFPLDKPCRRTWQR